MGESTSDQMLATLHVISYLCWAREGAETFEVRRARLLDRLAHDTTQTHFLLGGQTVILDDVAAVRPDLVGQLVNAHVGPWYVLVDQALASGESLVRNLLLGREDTGRYGGEPPAVAYTPGAGGYTAQLPQILRGFGLDVALLHHVISLPHLPFRWEAPDGSSVLVINAVGDLTHETDVQTSLAAQREVAPDGPYLWMQEKPVDEQRKMLEADVPVRQSTPADFIAALRRSLPDALRPALKGELRLQTGCVHSCLLPGRLSARLYLKQANARLQAHLTFATEPWLALALSQGQVAYPENLRALLAHSWRLLLQNQSQDALGGSSIDAVHEANDIRYRRIEDSSAQVIAGALEGLPGTPATTTYTPASEADETYVVVWNPHGWTVKQVVELPLRLPDGKVPLKLRSPSSDEVNFSWADSGRIGFLAEVPPLGYATYTVKLGTTLAEQYRMETAPGNVIANLSGETLLLEGDSSGGRLVWKRDGTQTDNLLRFVDGGDAGDVYNYSPPRPDHLVTARQVDDALVETSPLYSRLILKHRMRIAPALDEKRGRTRGLRLLELTTTATLYDEIPGLFFRTTFENTAQDHRLRAHLRTGIQSDTVTADGAFGLVDRQGTHTQPMHTLCAVHDDARTMALLARGLPAFEAVPEAAQTTLALTLVRAVGWLSRDDLVTRPTSVAPQVPVSGAQCRRQMTAEYALVGLDSNDPARLLRLGQAYNAPLQARQYTEKPDEPVRSYLAVEGEDVVLTAVKPPQRGTGWIARFLNPTDSTTDVTLKSLVRPRTAQRVNLAEDPQADLDISDAGVRVTLGPHQIVTVRFGFE